MALFCLSRAAFSLVFRLYFLLPPMTDLYTLVRSSKRFVCAACSAAGSSSTATTSSASLGLRCARFTRPPDSAERTELQAFSFARLMDAWTTSSAGAPGAARPGALRPGGELRLVTPTARSRSAAPDEPEAATAAVSLIVFCAAMSTSYAARSRATRCFSSSSADFMDAARAAASCCSSACWTDEGAAVTDRDILPAHALRTFAPDWLI